MQTAKMNSKSKKNGKSAVLMPVIPDTVGPQARNTEAAEPQTTVADTVTVEQPTAHPETDVRLLDLNKIVNSTYNPRKNFREDTLLELAESIKQSGVLQPICVHPKDEGFEIVYGERRYWAAAMAGLQFIPALIRELSDAEAEDAAITENLQREDVRPREEAAAYKRALQSGRHTIESLVGKFGKSEAYIRSRLKLCELIDALAEMLDREDISVGVATEIAKYPADIQQEVYDDHFAEGCYSSWKTARIKDIARRLYERYMTKLESYNFDKTECLSCQHNTANQVLFKDECTGGCAGCQNRECMIRKNNEFLVQKAVKLLKDDPHTTLATDGETPAAVLEALEKEGYHVEELEYSVYHYDKGPQMPDAPQAEEFESEEDFTEAKEEYEAEMAAFAEETQRLEFDISEGRVRKYAIIGILCFIGCSIFSLPYTPLVSVVVGVTNMIPFFGPFLGAAPSAFLILLVSPKQCLIFIVFIIVLQQIDGNIIGPKILGDATGISSFWVVVAITVGGGFAGVLGMFLGVPIFACLQTLVKYLTDRQLEKRHMPLEACEYVHRDQEPMPPEEPPAPPTETN